MHPVAPHVLAAHTFFGPEILPIDRPCAMSILSFQTPNLRPPRLRRLSSSNSPSCRTRVYSMLIGFKPFKLKQIALVQSPLDLLSNTVETG
jgi:hypothetical protein